MIVDELGSRYMNPFCFFYFSFFAFHVFDNWRRRAGWFSRGTIGEQNLPQIHIFNFVLQRRGFDFEIFVMNFL